MQSHVESNPLQEGDGPLMAWASPAFQVGHGMVAVVEEQRRDCVVKEQRT